jgi:hypothetical protein
MAGERTFMRIPPDSSGKRLKLAYTAQINYNSKQADYVWKIGQVYRIDNEWEIVVTGVYESSTTEGVLDVKYSRAAEYANISPDVGSELSSIIDPEATGTVATVVSFKDIYINTTNIVGDDNPENGLNIDRDGSALMTFAEGRPQLDAFGRLRVASSTHLGEYTFINESTMSNFAQTEINGGDVSYDTLTKGADVSTPGVAGAEARLTSHTYHYYTPGASHLYMSTAAVNDVTAEGAKRNWGLFDRLNGFAFTIDQTGQFGVTIRNFATGSIVNNFIPQTEFNRDRVNGTGGVFNNSLMNLDLTKDNIYWIDVQWHGAGRVRFGTYFNGDRIVMHEYLHGNKFDTPMTQTASLPISYTVENISASVPLQLRTWSGSVWTEVDLDPGRAGKNSSFVSDMFSVTAGPNDEPEPLFSFSPTVIDYGDENHRIYLPTQLNAISFDDATGEPRIAELQIVLEPVMSEQTFVRYKSSNLEISTTGVAYQIPTASYTRVFRGETSDNLLEVFNNYQYGGVKNYSDQGGTIGNTIANITQASPGVVTVNEPRVITREDDKTITFVQVGGMIELNGNSYYAKITGAQTFELYSDEALTVPVDTTGFGAYTTGGVYFGEFGLRQIWTVFAKNLQSGTTSSNVKVTFGWKEVGL